MKGLMRRVLKAIEIVIVVSLGLFVGFLWFMLIVAILREALNF